VAKSRRPDRNKPLARIAPCRLEDHSDQEQRLVARGVLTPPLKQTATSVPGVLGQANVGEVEPTMVFEDFAEFNLAGIPSADFWELLGH
jgi:hypothetical protein